MANDYLKRGDWNCICNMCNTEKHVSEFFIHSNGKPRKQCKVCHGLKGKAWRKANPEKTLELARRTREANYNKALEATKRWRLSNLAYDAFRARTYRARKLQAVPLWAKLDEIKDFYLNRPEGMHVDHIVPLKGKTVCGLHVLNNLQYLTPKENRSKRNLYG